MENRLKKRDLPNGGKAEEGGGLAPGQKGEERNISFSYICIAVSSTLKLLCRKRYIIQKYINKSIGMKFSAN